MSKPNKKEPKLYTICETIHISYQVVAMSEEDAQDTYRNMDNAEWQTMVGEAASCNFCDDEVTDFVDYDHESEAGDFPLTEKAQKYINKNLPEG
jgi:hypothetical protein